MKDALSMLDIIWLCGGNTPYFRYISRETGFDTIIAGFIQPGIIYGGESAGAIIATPTIKYVDIVDDPSEAPVYIE
jgi:dipeptidase E